MSHSSVIPPIIHQMWKTDVVPDRFLSSAESWRRHHPTWTYRLWTDESIEAFVREHYPGLLPLFLAYPDQIQRVDVSRYMILHHFGGLYSDLDIECLRPFDALREHEVVLSKTQPVGYSNDLMMTVAGHPLFASLIERLPAAQRRWGHFFVLRHFRVMLTTGSLYLTNTLRDFSDKRAVHTLDEGLYSSQNRNVAYVYHWPGDTWAGWDTHMLVFIHHNWKWLLASVTVLTVLAYCAAFRPFG